MRAKPYSRYKRSGIDWLGNVPEHWEVKRSDGIVSADRSQLPPQYFSDREVFHYSIPIVQETGTGQIEHGEDIASAKQVIKKSVVLVSKLNPRKATICRAYPQEILTLCSTEFVALNGDRCDLDFLEYLTRSEVFRQNLDSKVQSVTRSHQRANPEDIYKFWNAWPSLPEQRAIAAFLEHETTRIDALLTKKRTLIEKLKEKHAALIAHTVTRGLPPETARAAGLDPYPKLKPSGIVWLGDIPARWSVRRLGHLSVVVRGASPRPAGDSRFFDGEFIPWITVGEVTKDDGMYLRSTETMLTEDGAASSRVIHAGTLVLTNSGATLGVPKVLGITGCANDGIVAFENLSRNVSKMFLYYYLCSLTENLRDRVKQGSGQPNLNTDIIKALAVPLPPISEQDAIADYLDREATKTDRMVEKVEEAIERLREVRAALITAAVTGTIDVRGITEQGKSGGLARSGRRHIPNTV